MRSPHYSWHTTQSPDGFHEHAPGATGRDAAAEAHYLLREYFEKMFMFLLQLHALLPAALSMWLAAWVLADRHQIAQSEAANRHAFIQV